MTKINWINTQGMGSKGFLCGHCGHSIASQLGYHGKVPTNTSLYAYIYICHQCDKPTFFDLNGRQTPGPIFGQQVKFIPDESITKMFDEARSCYTINAFTSTVMCCRKLLMHIAVIEGAEEGKSFVDYVNYLNDNNYIPPRGKSWVDSIRKLGNAANHKIEFKSNEDAKLALTFIEMLLRFIYEMPGFMQETKPEE